MKCFCGLLKNKFQIQKSKKNPRKIKLTFENLYDFEGKLKYIYINNLTSVVVEICFILAFLLTQ